MRRDGEYVQYRHGAESACFASKNDGMIGAETPGSAHGQPVSAVSAVSAVVRARARPSIRRTPWSAGSSSGSFSAFCGSGWRGRSTAAVTGRACCPACSSASRALVCLMPLCLPAHITMRSLRFSSPLSGGESVSRRSSCSGVPSPASSSRPPGRRNSQPHCLRRTRVLQTVAPRFLGTLRRRSTVSPRGTVSHPRTAVHSSLLSDPRTSLGIRSAAR